MKHDYKDSTKCEYYGKFLAGSPGAFLERVETAALVNILGRDDEPEEYSDGTYFTMLFSAGVGIGLFFFGVAEPILHYAAKKGYKENRYYQR